MRPNTIDDIAGTSGAPADLVRAVIEQMDGTVNDNGEVDDETLDTLRDVMEHGAAGGVSGFIYYSETSEFYRANRKAIVALLKDTAEELGESSALSLVKTFRCAKDFDEDEIAATLYGSEPDDMVANCLAWFALEEVARAMDR